MSSSNLNTISRADGRVMNACENVNNEDNRNNVGYALNDDRNEIINEENEIQNGSIVLERRTDRELKHEGKLEETNKVGAIRTCSTNVHGFGGNNEIKTDQMTKTIDQMSIDVIIINETNCKWNNVTIEKLRNKLTRVSKDVRINTSNGKEHELTKNDYLPGGTLIVTIGKLSSCIVESTKKENKLGKWNKNEKKYNEKDNYNKLMQTTRWV